MTDRATPSTIVDVARAAGVSVATVSRALRGLDRVSPSTRERVRRVAYELNYLASPTATSLASGQTRIIGVIVPFASRWYFASMVAAIGKALRERGYQVLLFDLEQEPFGGRHELTRSMLWKRVDGVVSISIAMTQDELDLLTGLHVPVVSIGFDLAGRPSVRIDDYQAARTAIEHILDLGHVDVAFIGVEPPSSQLNATPQERLAAFRDALDARDLPIREDWVLATDWTADDARRLTHEILSASGPRPTAVMCASDEIAFGVHMAAREFGLRLPADLSIVGIDDHNLASLFGLTTVRQDFAAQGEQSAVLLLDAIAQQQAPPGGPRRVLVDTEFVRRSSTAPPPPAR